MCFAELKRSEKTEQIAGKFEALVSYRPQVTQQDFGSNRLTGNTPIHPVVF